MFSIYLTDPGKSMLLGASVQQVVIRDEEGENIIGGFGMFSLGLFCIRLDISFNEYTIEE